VPDALRDRLEIIDLPGYIPEEKVEIAARYLLPRERDEAGLAPGQLALSKAGMLRVIREYTHEAGVRELARQLARICRKRAAKVVAGESGLVRVGADDVPAWLGPPRVQQDRLERRLDPGVVLGLAWTPVGGDVLFIEGTTMPGKGGMRLTGQLGEVMSESANLALSYVRAHAGELGIDPKVFTEKDLHVHFPSGAVKKDGPSAGVTITTALVSLLTNRAVRPRLAMTGEMTLRGEVLPVGGVREKVVAARRIGVHTVVLPERNRADVEEIPKQVREHVEFVFARTYDDVLAAALPAPKRTGKGEAGVKATTAERHKRSRPAAEPAKRERAAMKGARRRS
jgi:ATP-dependent Lon protease